MLTCFKDRFGLQQHARAAPKRAVIDRPMTIVRVIAQIVDPQLEESGVACPLDNAFIERPRKHCGEQREHVDFHSSPLAPACAVAYRSPASCSALCCRL